jgi:hypothetical protein
MDAHGRALFVFCLQRQAEAAARQALTAPWPPPGQVMSGRHLAQRNARGMGRSRCRRRGTTGLFTAAVWRAAWVVAIYWPGLNRSSHHGAVRGVWVVAAAIVTASGSGAGTRRRPRFVFLL